MVWKLKEAPSQAGRVALVTGSNTGLGFETAKELSRLGAKVIMACRNAEKAQAAADKIRAEIPDADLDLVPLDLGSLASVKACADQINANYDRLDLQINNAGLMMTPRFETEDGFEGQLGTNYLGHFALTAHLFDLVTGTKDARIVSLASQAHRFGWIKLDDLQLTKFYDRRLAYGQSKAACLMFAFELNRRLRAKGIETKAVAAHPGVSNTELMRYLPKFLEVAAPLVAQAPDRGALPTLYAALGYDIAGGDYVGPNGFMEMVGEPVKVGSTRRSRNETDAAHLFDMSEQLTGVQFPLN